MDREGEITQLESIQRLVNFAPLVVVNRNDLNASFFLYVFCLRLFLCSSNSLLKPMHLPSSQ